MYYKYIFKYSNNNISVTVYKYSIVCIDMYLNTTFIHIFWGYVYMLWYPEHCPRI